MVINQVINHEVTSEFLDSGRVFYFLKKRVYVLEKLGIRWISIGKGILKSWSSLVATVKRTFSKLGVYPEKLSLKFGRVCVLRLVKRVLSSYFKSAIHFRVICVILETYTTHLCAGYNLSLSIYISVRVDGGDSFTTSSTHKVLLNQFLLSEQ